MINEFDRFDTNEQAARSYLPTNNKTNVKVERAANVIQKEIIKN